MMFSSMDFKKSCLGFINDTELLPEDFDHFNSEMKLRQLFLNLVNNSLKEYCSFSKYEQKKLSKYSLKTSFTHKINMLMPNSFIKQFTQSKSFIFCKNSTKVINAYKNNKSCLINSKTCNVKVAKLISICFVNSKLQLVLDKNLLFHEFVFRKIKKLHKNKIVKDHGNSISITGENVSALKIYTSWKDIETKKPDIKEELQSAIDSIKKDGYLQVYLVYPKMNAFKRHIPIFVDELKKDTYKIKAIPYSLRSTLRNNI